MDAKSEYHLKKLIKELKSKRGRHTELVTVYVPAGFDINGISNQISQEQGTASNIKSKATRKNVTDALEKVLQNLKLYKQTPPNGLAIFSGNVSEREGLQDLQIWAIEPAEPINVRVYRCDQTFVTEPLENMIAEKDVYLLIAIDNKTATVATLKGDSYIIVKKFTSDYHGKHRAGGQSHRRFERIIEDQAHRFRVRIAEVVNDIFLSDIKSLRGIVIGGPVAAKEDFAQGDYLHHELKKKIIAIKDITYTDESGIRELITASQDVLSDVQIVRQKELMQRFFGALVKDGAVAYGDRDIEAAFDRGAVDVMLLSENLDEDVIDYFYDRANATGASVEILPDSFEEGFQLWNTFKGKAAILRFKAL